MSDDAEMHGLWVVIPAFNEASVVSRVVTDVRRRYRNVVVVDDGSSDPTGQEALAAGAIVLRHPINLGQGAALQTGIAFALDQGAEHIVTFDADGQHGVDDVCALESTQLRTGAAVVLGSRFLGRSINMPLKKTLLLKAAVLFTRLTTGMRITDAHNGLRLLTRYAAGRIHLRQNRMAHASEILGQICRAKLSYAEAPVTISYTEYSLAKGQGVSNSFNILMELLVGRLAR